MSQETICLKILRYASSVKDKEAMFVDLAQLLYFGDKEDEDRNALLKACLAPKPSLSFVRELLQLNEIPAYINTPDLALWTPLICISMTGEADIARYLLDYGAELEFRDVESRTALHYAARQNNCEVVDLLLDRGSDINAVAVRIEGVIPVKAINSPYCVDYRLRESHHC